MEIHYHLGLEEEAKKYASILGYNYNSSKWFEQTYKIFNENYKLTQEPVLGNKKSENKSLIKKIIKMIK